MPVLLIFNSKGHRPRLQVTGYQKPSENDAYLT